MAAPTRHFIKITFWFFIILIFLHSMAAYAIVGVPIPWIAQAGFVVVFLWIFSHQKIYVFPGLTLFLIFFIWTLGITIFNSTTVDYSELMGIRATTSYPVYISLRFLSLVVFIATAGSVYWLCKNGMGNQVVNTIANIGVLVSLIAVYIYIAQTYGLPEPPRTRVGTTGHIQKTVFTYAFHRALGSFREPSHMAQWLIVPLFFSYISSKKVFNLRGFIIGSAILLSGSLTGIIGGLLGLTGATAMVNGFRIRKFFSLLKFAFPFVGAWAIFTLLVVGAMDTNIDLVGIIVERIEPILFEKGVYSTNRSYVYEYFDQQALSFFGLGLGNANIKFGYDIGSPAMPSLLNLFMMLLLSTGLIGIVLATLFLAYPFYLHYRVNYGRNYDGFIYLMAAYIAWIFMYIMHAEEFTMFFGVVYGLIMFYIFDYKRNVLNQQ